MQVRKESQKNFGFVGIRTLASAIPAQCSNQSSQQANCWQLVSKLVRNIPGRDEDEAIISTTFIIFIASQKYEVYTFSQRKNLLVKILLFKTVVRNLILCTLSQTSSQMNSQFFSVYFTESKLCSCETTLSNTYKVVYL